MLHKERDVEHSMDSLAKWKLWFVSYTPDPQLYFGGAKIAREKFETLVLVDTLLLILLKLEVYIEP